MPLPLNNISSPTSSQMHSLLYIVSHRKHAIPFGRSIICLVRPKILSLIWLETVESDNILLTVLHQLLVHTFLFYVVTSRQISYTLLPYDPSVHEVKIKFFIQMLMHMSSHMYCVALPIYWLLLNSRCICYEHLIYVASIHVYIIQPTSSKVTHWSINWGLLIIFGVKLFSLFDYAHHVWQQHFPCCLLWNNAPKKWD